MRFLSLAAVLGAASLAGAVPAQIPHEGRLLRADGSPERGSQSLTFALYTQAAGGTAVWSESQSVVVSASGYYAALLGQSAALPALTAPDYWLGITVQGETEMLPRARLASVPFALRAALAEDTARVGGDAASEILRRSSSLDASKLSGTLPTASLPIIPEAKLPASVPLLDGSGGLAVTGLVDAPNNLEIVQTNDARLLYAPPDFTCTAGNWCNGAGGGSMNRFATDARYTYCGSLGGDANCSANYVELVLNANPYRTVLLSHQDWTDTRVVMVYVSFDGGANFLFHKALDTHKVSATSGPPYLSSIRAVVSNLPLGIDVRVRLVAAKGRMRFEGLGLSKMVFPETDAQPIHTIARASANGPEDGTCGVNASCGPLPLATRQLTFVKTQAATSVRVHYIDNMRADGVDGTPRSCDWLIRFNGNACPAGEVFGTSYVDSGNPLRHRSVGGYCPGLPVGAYTVQVYVRNTAGYQAGCYTGWSGRWLLEAEEVQ